MQVYIIPVTDGDEGVEEQECSGTQLSLGISDSVLCSHSKHELNSDCKTMLALSVLKYATVTVFLFVSFAVTAAVTDNEQLLVSVIFQAELGEHDVVDISCTTGANGAKAEKVLRGHEAREFSFQVADLASGSVVCNFLLIGPVVGEKFAFHVPVWLGVLEPGFLCGTDLEYRCVDVCLWVVYKGGIYLSLPTTFKEYECRQFSNVP
ncbi:hypothetical protein R1sor_021428 [Riccia sorocarpa]|uniref:Uncharacterized protein n=1 Tax=Riccia sorocarpa TaxID=122646 RepID=A0ABD3GJZ7_9MARC